MKTYISSTMPQYKANLHCHSTVSDGKLTPAELKEAYKDHGYSVLAITDHERPFDHSDMTDKDFLMLTGYEAYIRIHGPKSMPYEPELHCNLIARDPHNEKYVNFTTEYCKYVSDPAIRASFEKVGKVEEPREYSVAYINDFVKSARENGYMVTYNHPVWSLESDEQIFGYEGFFSMEMCNYSSYLINRLEYNGALYDKLLCRGRRIACHSADDNHNKHAFGQPGCDSFGGFTYILADELTYDSVIRALDDGRFYSSMGPQIRELTFDGSKVHIESSDAVQITMFFGSKGPKSVKGDMEHPVNAADFEIPEKASYVRFDVCDIYGRHANTRGFFRDELGI